MDKATHPLKDFLGPGGLKHTRGRETILRELEVRKGHFNAETLYSVLNRKGTKVSRPTIYRTLKLLEKNHLIDRLDIKQKCFYYESILQKKDHAHLICEQCGKIMDFQNSSLKTLKTKACKEEDFLLDSMSVQLFGLCRSCQRTIKNRTRAALESDSISPTGCAMTPSTPKTEGNKTRLRGKNDEEDL